LAVGVASVEDERPLTSEDRFRIASVTKAFTAAVVMELVEERALSLDDSVEHWAPGLLAEGDSITVRYLLAHTSGLPDYTKDEEFIEAFVAGEDLPPDGVGEGTVEGGVDASNTGGRQRGALVVRRG